MPAPGAVRAPWSEEPELRAAVRRLRQAGDTVLAVLPGEKPDATAVACDRELVRADGRWVVRAIGSAGEPTPPRST
jgi:ATP phosphoribosyltransferase regulatory subunit